MVIYIVTYSVVTFLFFSAEKVKKKQRFIPEYFAVFLLCALAGLRETGIGTDTALYLRPLIDVAQFSSSYSEYLNSVWFVGWETRETSQYEIAFRFVIYLVAKLSHSAFLVQFTIQLLIVIPVYCVLKRRNDVQLWFGMLVYILLFNNFTYNAIRQAIAMSFSLMALQLWMEESRKKSIAWIFAGYLFHASGLVAICIIILFEFVQRDRKCALQILGTKVDARYANMVLMIGVSVFFLLGANAVAAILRSTFLWRFAGYISGQVRFMPNQLIKLLPPLVISGVNFKRIEMRTGQARFYFSAIVITIVLLQFTSVNPFGGRVAEYFMYIGILSYPVVCRNSKYSEIAKLAMLGYLLFYWFFYYGFGNVGETVPYQVMGR